MGDVPDMRACDEALNLYRSLKDIFYHLHMLNDYYNEFI